MSDMFGKSFRVFNAEYLTRRDPDASRLATFACRSAAERPCSLCRSNMQVAAGFLNRTLAAKRHKEGSQM
jgi:hypothetical protein